LLFKKLLYFCTPSLGRSKKINKMYAIVDIAGQQFKVAKDQKLFVHRLENAVGSKVELNKVLLVENEGDVKVGSPVIDGVSVSATVLEHVKGDKVVVFKKKRRKGYRVKNGHRQAFTQIQIDAIGGDTSKPKAKAVKAKKAAEEVSNEE